MSQNSLILPTTGTVSGLQMTNDINNALDTLNTLASGTSAPGSPEAGQFWHDTTNNLLKIRSLDNTSWVPFLQINETAYLAAPANTPTGTNDRANRVINGAMAIDQMNEGASYSVPANNTQTYTLDQWFTYCNASGSPSGVTIQRVTDAPAGFANSLKVTVGTGAGSVGVNDYFFVAQPIEANNLSDLNFGTANAVATSLSFWVKCSIAGTYAVALQNFAQNRSIVYKFTVSTGGVWQQIQIPNIPGDQSGTWATGSSGMLQVVFTIATGSTYQSSTLGSWLGADWLGSNTQTNSVLTTSGATFQIAGVQFNSGAFCQPFDRRFIQQELLDCQRYFEKGYDIGVAAAATSSASGSFLAYATSTTTPGNKGFSVTKRADPSITLYSPVSGSSGKIADTTSSTDVTVSAVTVGQSAFTFSWTSTSGHIYQQQWTASARM